MDVFAKSLYYSVIRHDSIIGTADAELTYFKKRGEKIMTWHGLPGSLITPDNTVSYAQRVYERDPQAAESYRFFERRGWIIALPNPGGIRELEYRV